MESYHLRTYLTQNYNNNFFDVIFCVDGRELHAHREILAQQSSVFKELLMKNRSTGNEPIQIDGYSYDEFFEFIRLIYCRNDDKPIRTNRNSIFAVIELAHDYGIYKIKEEAGKDLLLYGGFKALNNNGLTDADYKDVFEKIAFAYKYSLEKFKYSDSYLDFMKKHLSDLIRYEGFINLDESVITAFVCYALYESNNRQKKELCKSVYKWGEYQAMITVETSDEEKKELILHYIKDVLPFSEFKDMFSPKFLIEFAVPNGVISIDEANKYATIDVFIHSNDTTLIGSFVDRYGIYEIFKSHTDYEFNHEELFGRGSNQRCFWNEKVKRPSTPSTVKKMKGCEWYLAIDRYGKLNFKSKITKTDYLIAEMKTFYGPAFTLDKNSRVFATVDRDIL